MGIVELLNYVGIDCDHVTVDGKKVGRMSEELNAMGIEKPSVGRIVHYMTQEGNVRPAIVVEVVTGLRVHLNVFYKNNDVHDEDPGEPIVWDANGAKGTWHWPFRGNITEKDPFDNEPHPEDIEDLEK